MIKFLGVAFACLAVAVASCGPASHTAKAAECLPGYHRVYQCSTPTPGATTFATPTPIATSTNPAANNTASPAPTATGVAVTPTPVPATPTPIPTATATPLPPLNTYITSLPPTHYFRLDQASGTGTVAYDTSTVLQGAYVGGYTLQSTAITANDTGSVLLDGTSGYVQTNILTNDATFTGADFSVGIWYNPAFNSTVANYRLAANGHVDSGDQGYQLYATTNSGFQCDSRNGATFTSVRAAVPIVVGSPYFVSCVFSSTQQAQRIYVNGVLYGVSTTTIVNPPTGAAAFTTRLGTGVNYTGDFVNGRVSEFFLAARALTPTEEQSIFTAGHATAATPAPAPTTTSSSVYLPATGSYPYPSGPNNPFNNPIGTPVYLSNDATLVNSVLTKGGTDYFSLGQLQVATHPLTHTDGSNWPYDGNTTVYVAHNSDPAYTLHCMYYTNCPLEGLVEHIPVGALPAGNLNFTTFTDTGHDDQHMAVRNDDTSQQFDTWLTPTPNGVGGTLNIGYGGYYPYSSGGVGQGGATASGFSLTQGRLRAADILNNQIPYALSFTTPCENGHVAPATGNDNVTPDATCPAIGQRLYLDSTPTQIANSGATRTAQVIMNALHTYGGYIGDEANTHLAPGAVSGLGYVAYGVRNPWIDLISQDFPTYTDSGPATNQYNLGLSTGNIDLRVHLHFIAYP